VACCIRSLLWRIRPDVNVVLVPSVHKINSKGTAVLMRGVPVIAANPRDGSRLLRFFVNAPNTDPEIGHNSPRARGRMHRGRKNSAATSAPTHRPVGVRPSPDRHELRKRGLTVSPAGVLNEVPRDFGCTSWASGSQRA
jgi:hypothetical protein